MKEPKITEGRQGERAFVDALRESLGLGPLYAPDKPSSQIRMFRDIGELDYGCRRSPQGSPK